MAAMCFMRDAICICQIMHTRVFMVTMLPEENEVTMEKQISYRFSRTIIIKMMLESPGCAIEPTPT
jgi:hypothetical protein